MSSDKLGSIQQPVVSVDLDLCEGGETRKENVELSKDELEQFITSLEAANKVHVHMFIVHSQIFTIGYTLTNFHFEHGCAVLMVTYRIAGNIGSH